MLASKLSQFTSEKIVDVTFVHGISVYPFLGTIAPHWTGAVKLPKNSKLLLELNYQYSLRGPGNSENFIETELAFDECMFLGLDSSMSRSVSNAVPISICCTTGARISRRPGYISFIMLCLAHMLHYHAKRDIMVKLYCGRMGSIVLSLLCLWLVVLFDYHDTLRDGSAYSLQFFYSF